MHAGDGRGQRLSTWHANVWVCWVCVCVCIRETVCVSGIRAFLFAACSSSLMPLLFMFLLLFVKDAFEKLLNMLPQPPMQSGLDF